MVQRIARFWATTFQDRVFIEMDEIIKINENMHKLVFFKIKK